KKWPWAEMKRRFDIALGKEGKYNRTSKPVAFILKDPISVLIAQLIDKNFPANCYFIVMVRDPYSVIESTTRKLKRSFKVKDIPKITKRATQEWIECQKIQKENVENIKKCIWFRYEDLFGDKRKEIAKRITSFIPELADINFDIKFDSQSVTHAGNFKNYNGEQRQRLKPEQIQVINEELKKHIELLNFFGYKIWEK
ncbi:MAG: hypothetical protein ACW99L_16460, partial [Promethearchaeota archaeon]